MDSITLFKNEIKRYIITAIDLKTGFGFAHAYEKLTSLNALDFMKKFKSVSPFRVRRVQTDNGLEFEKHFHEYLKKEGIIHFHNYPKRPQMNPYVERFNRTIKEQHVRWNKDKLYDIKWFNQDLVEYLLWYNTKKPHKRLKKLPPLRYYIDNFTTDIQNPICYGRLHLFAILLIKEYKIKRFRN